MSRTEIDRLARVVGRAIARHRVAANLTQEQVAEHLGIGNEAVSRMERGVVMPTVQRLVELADIFKCDASELLTEASTRSSDQASHLAGLLTKVSGPDRVMIVNMVETLTTRLARR